MTVLATDITAVDGYVTVLDGFKRYNWSLNNVPPLDHRCRKMLTWQQKRGRPE